MTLHPFTIYSIDNKENIECRQWRISMLRCKHWNYLTRTSLSWSPLNKNIEYNTYTCICYILNRLFVVLMMSIDKQKAVPLSLLTPPYQTRSVRWEGFIRGHSHPIEGRTVIHAFCTCWLHVLIHVHVFIQRSLFHAYIWFCMVRVLWSIITISTICNWKKKPLSAFSCISDTIM